MKKLLPFVVLLSAASASPAPLAQEFVYREYDLLEQYEPHVSGDLKLSGSYEHWKDPTKLDYRMAGNPDDNWKLNWKFMDPPFNQAVHGGHFALDRGEKLFKQLNANGGFADCLGATKGKLKGLRAGYPRWRDDLKHVAGLEEVIEQCAGKQGRLLQNGSYDNSAVSIYLSSLSNGMPVSIDVTRSGPMKQAYERGRKLFHLKSGAFNFACSSCHTHNVGKHLRGNIITTPYGDVAHYPVYKTQYLLQSLHLRFAECNLDTRTQPLVPGSKSYTDLEVFMTALSNGFPVTVPAERDW
jgi:L-cysteine S-thiosulfotransferase